MKRLRIAGLLSAALLVFVMSGAAQTKDDVVNAYNAGAKAFLANDLKPNNSILFNIRVF